MKAQRDFQSLPKATFGQAQSAKKGWQLPRFLLQTPQMGCGQTCDHPASTRSPGLGRGMVLIL